MAEERVKISDLTDVGNDLENFYVPGAKVVDGIPETKKANLGTLAGKLTELEGEMTDLVGKDEEIIDTSVYEPIKGIINTSGSYVYVSNNSYNHILVPVSAGERYTISSSEAQKGYYAFLTKYEIPTAQGDVASLCEGYTGRIEMAEDSSVIVTIPEDCTYLYLSRTNNNADTSCSLTRLAKEGRIDVISEKAEQIDNKLVLTQMDICYGRAITTDGTSDTKRRVGRGATSYIPCKGAKTLKYRNMVTIDASAAADTGLAFYDKDKVFISFVPGVRSTTTSGYRDDVIDVPSNAHFFRASYWNYDYAVKDTTKAYGEFYAELSSADIIRNGKRASSNDYVYFSAKVNQSPDKWWETGSDESKQATDINVTNGVLLLPPAYSMTGEKTKVIINFHGYSHKVSHDYWGNEDGEHRGFLIQKQRWAAAGYAVMDCNNDLYSLNTNQSGFGSLQSMNAYRACWEWVKTNYNVDERPFIVCGSAGGPTGINCCYSWGDVRASVWLDCWTTMARCWEVSSSRVAALYGLADETTYDYEKLRNYDPTKNVLEVGDVNYALAPRCPIKVMWLTELYAGTLIGALKEHQIGGVVDVRKVTGINHSDLVSGGDGTNPNSAYIDEEIIAWLDSH